MRQPTSKLPLFPNKMSQIHIKGVPTLRTMWSPYHVVPVTSKDIILNTAHPKHEQFRRKWESRTDPLWWSFLSTKQISMKRVVREWLNNRSREAFINALKRKGYDRNGYRIDNSGGEAPKDNLVGSLHCFTCEELLRTKWPELEEQADRIVTEIERRQSITYSKGKGKKKETV